MAEQNDFAVVLARTAEVIKQDPAAKIENNEQVYLDFTVEHMLSHIRLLEDHFLDIATDRNVLQCFACSYWHLFSLISYDSLERPKFDPNYDTRFLKWLEKTIQAVQDRAIDRDQAKQLVKELREWRYYFVGEENAAIPDVQLHQAIVPALDPELYVQLHQALGPELSAFYDVELSSPYKTVAEIEAVLAEKETALAEDPARKLVKYIKRSGNMKSQFVDLTRQQFRDLTGKHPNHAVISPKTGRIPWEYALDLISPEYDQSPEDLKDAVERCHKTMNEIEELKHDLAIARESTTKGKACTRLETTEDACTDPIYGDSCKAKTILCQEEQMLAVRNPSSWDIHVLRDGEAPSEATSLGKVRYAREASGALKDLTSALTVIQNSTDEFRVKGDESQRIDQAFAMSPELARFYQ